MNDSRKVYLDHSATTPVDPRVVAAMLPYFTQKFGNASSVHFFGQEARAAVDRARREVAALIGARANEIVFLSGGTEANNLAIRGVCEAASGHSRHLITSTIEHSSVRGICEGLGKSGWEITRLPAYEEGVVQAEDVRAALRPNTVLISVMLANNEIGTIQPIEEIAALVREERARGRRQLWFHTDAVQAAGRIPLHVDTLGCDLLSLSAHKLYAPKGAGALFVRRGVRLVSQNVGGHQEREKRAGTEGVPGIVAFGAAAKLAREEMAERSQHDQRLRDRFEAGVTERIGNVVFNGDRGRRLPHLSNISFRFIEGEGLLISLDLQGIAVSTGSACSSGTLEPSPVIRALGRNDELARGAIRFSFGKDNTEQDVEYVLEVLPRVVEKLRALSPLNREEMGRRDLEAIGQN
ncbi:MAG TPA: cysteine desulfurase NifS [Blastocatellia bacterium]|jgi:cysteine desulfurase|nr:cysteine desulfurase NifS [Blastocatellia bacterium]HAF23125.1 cysteine desulfurase NifS [Blastocatellia bacterium]